MVAELGEIRGLLAQPRQLGLELRDPRAHVVLPAVALLVIELVGVARDLLGPGARLGLRALFLVGGQGSVTTQAEPSRGIGNQTLGYWLSGLLLVSARPAR